MPRGVEVRDRDDLVTVQQELAAVPGVTVLIHDQECAAEKHRKRKRGKVPTPTTRVMINERICEGCGDCGEKSNCLTVHPVDTEFGHKTTIHQSSCNVDYSCLKGDCPSFVTVTPGPVEQRAAVPAIAADVIAEPEYATVGDEFGMRILGVGGTGAVTVAQILATAAVIDGKFVRSLDQTGLAQKGGAVVSDLKISNQLSPQAAKIGQRRSIRLHPPLLRAMGMKTKLSLGSWVNPGLRVLHSMRRVRGTRLDVFGYHHIRRMERALITEYRDTVETLLRDLKPETLAAAVEIAALPDMVRGYEEIKAGNVDAYHRTRSRLLAAYPKAKAVVSLAG